MQPAQNNNQSIFPNGWICTSIFQNAYWCLKPFAFLAAVIFIVFEAPYRFVYDTAKDADQTSKNQDLSQICVNKEKQKSEIFVNKPKQQSENWQSKINLQEETPITIDERMQYMKRAYQPYGTNLLISNSKHLCDQIDFFDSHRRHNSKFETGQDFFIALIADPNERKIKVFYHNLPTNIKVTDANIETTLNDNGNWTISYDDKEKYIIENCNAVVPIATLCGLIKKDCYTFKDGTQEMEEAIRKARNTNQQFSLQ